MILLHNIGPKPEGPAASNYNTPEQIAAYLSNECMGLLTFDGVYKNVWEHRQLISNLCLRSPILFVMGAYVGKDNTFDAPMPYEEYCDWWQLLDLVANHDCVLGWHTWTHRDLTKLSDADVRTEIKPPFPMKHFAYPYGNVDARVARLVQEAGYEDAWSVHQGDDSRFQKRRRYL